MSALRVRIVVYTLTALLSGCVGMSGPPAPVRSAGTDTAPAAPEPVVQAFPVEETPAPDATPILPDPDSPGGRLRLGLLGTTATGARVYLSDFPGKVVVATFWTTWCPPCWGEMPHLQALRRDYAPQELVVLAINYREEPDAIIEFVKQQEAPPLFPVLSDALGIAARDRAVVTLPSTLLFDRRGQLSRRYSGMFGMDVGQLRADIDRLLAEPRP